jgi:hypothetical protein
VAEALLNPCLGRPVWEVVQMLRLGDAKWSWAHEPPGILRGASYVPVDFPADGRLVTLYIAAGEPLFRLYRERLDWDYEVFLGCRVGGIQSEAGDIHLDVGPAVPWQFRRP